MSKDSFIAVGIGFVVLLLLGAIIINLPTNGGRQNNQGQPQPTAAAANAKLQIIDEKTGTGPAVKSGDTITVNYTGSLANGKVFDTSVGRQPFTTKIGAGQVIKGWDEGLIGMKVGGKRKLVIPPNLGYGARGAGSAIPPNATLTFEIELLSIQ